MSSFLLNLDLDFQSLTENSKKFTESLRGVDKATTQFTGLNSAVEKTSKGINAAEKSLGKLGAATALLGLGASLFGIYATLESVKDIAIETLTTFKELTGYARGLTFAEAISGSKELSDNLDFLEKAKFDVLNLGLVIDSVFDSENVTQWSAQSVSAFAKVEQSAYRLSTITVQGNERSIDSLTKNIEAMRELQKATNFAVDSVTLLNTEYNIASAGFTNKKDLQNVGKASINLSQSGFGDVESSTDAVVKVLKALGESSDDASTRAAQLFETTKVGLLTLDQLSGEIGGLAVSSKSLGVDFEEVQAALAGLTIKGVSAGEAGTELNALFKEIADGSEEANRLLANFRDSAGKPIQLNASALREKGLKGIIDDLKTATNGNVSAIQKLFNTQEAQKAAQLLISLGDDFTTFSDKIRNASGDTLTAEAENRGKTLAGAYTKSLNESKKGIEDFGQGAAPSALEDLTGTNTIVHSLAVKSAEFTGGLVGGITGAVEKFKLLGGLASTIFSTVLPLALFQYIFSQSHKLIGLIGSFKQEGETIWQTFKRSATEAFDIAKVKFDDLVTYIVKKIQLVNQESLTIKVQSEESAQNQLENTATPVHSQAQQTHSENQKASTTAIKSQSNVVTEAARAERSTGGFLTRTRSLVGSVGTDVGNFGRNAFGRASEGANGFFKGVKSFVGGVGKEALTMFAGIGIAGIAIGGGLAIASGWFETVGKVLNRSTIPELQEMRENLKGLDNVEGLKAIVDRLDPVTASAKNSNDELSQTAAILGTISGAWNILIGSATQYAIIEEEISNAQDKLTASINSNLSAAANGTFGAKSDKGKVAENKFGKGIELTSDDKGALELEQRQRIQEVDANIALQRQKVIAFEAKGNGDQEKLEKLKEELKTLESQGSEEKKKLDLQLKQLELKDAVNKLKSVSTTIPLSIQINADSEQSIKNQIEGISKDFKKGLEGTLKDAVQFDNLKAQLEGAFKGIAVEAEIDPEAATKLQKQIESSFGSDLAKLYKVNPQLREVVRATNKTVTEANIKQSQTNLSSRTSVLEATDSLGSNSTGLAFVKYKANIAALNEQAKALSYELNKPETSIARQIELTAQLEELEAKRVGLNADIAIKSELTARKQNLILAQELLNLEQAKLDLYNQENKFNLFSISTSQAKLNAAEQELKVKKESLSITNKEEELKKQTIVNSLNEKVKRDSNKVGALFGASGKNADQVKEQNRVSQIQEKSKLDIASAKEKEVYNTELQAKLKTLEKTKDVFTGKESSEGERQKIIKGIRELAYSSPKTANELKSVIGNKDFNKIAGVDEKEFQSAVFDDKFKLKNADKIKKLLIQNTTNQSGLNTTVNEDVKSAAEVFYGDDKNPGSHLAYAQQRKAARDKTKSDIANVDTKNKTASKELNSGFEAANKKVDIFSRLKEQTQSILASVGIGTAKTVDTTVKGKKPLTTANQDLIDTKSINSIKELVNDFGSVIKISMLKIENEFASREKIIKQGEMLSSSLQAISGNTAIFGQGVTAASLELTNFQAAKPFERLNKDAEQANKQIDSAQSQRSGLVDKLNAKIADAVSQGVSPDKIKELTGARNVALKDKNTGAKEGVIDKETVKQQTELGKLSAALKESTLKINKEYASRELLLTSATEVTDSLNTFSSGLGSVLNTILPNSAAAAKLNTTVVTAKTTTDSEKRSLDSDKAIRFLDERLKGTQSAVDVAKRTGVTGINLKNLEDTNTGAKKEVGIEKEILQQKNAILNANDKLTIFGAKLNESNTVIQGQIDILGKQTQTAKDNLDLEQRKKDNAGENNRSGTGLQSAFINFLGKNNPFATLIQQRLDVKQTNEDAKLAESKNVTEAKKEIIDTTLQKAQINLEEEGYKNALSQTALLSDVLTVLQGGKATLSSNSLIQDAIKNIPTTIQTASNLGKEKGKFLDEKLSYIPEELKQKNANIERDATAKNLNTLGSNLLPENTDLTIQALKSGQNNIANFQRQPVTVGSLNDKEFKDSLNRITSVSNLANTDNTKTFSNAQSKSNVPMISAPVSISITVPEGATGMNGNQFQSDLKTYVGKQIDTGLNKLSNNVLAAITK